MGQTQSLSDEISSVNPMTDIQVIMKAHKDRIRCMVAINCFLLASGADDGSLSIWEVSSGVCRHSLHAHHLPITCLSVITLSKTQTFLLSGSSDRTVKIWNPFTGECLHTLIGHTSGVTCITQLYERPNIICTGGNGSFIFLWHLETGEEVGKIVRNEEENLYCMITLKGNILVTGSNSHILYAYDTVEMCYKKILPIVHDKAVTCLINVNDSMFASASADGSITLYDVENQTVSAYLQKSKKGKTGMVNQLCMVGPNFLGAAVGSGFKFFHIHSAQCVLECAKAHVGLVSDLIPLYGNTRIATCSLDGTIRIWGSPNNKTLPNIFKQDKRNSPASSNLEILTKRDKGPLQAFALATMSLHSDQVTNIVPFSQFGFASCGNDGMIVYWKDGRMQQELRNFQSHQNFVREHKAVGFKPLFPDLQRDGSSLGDIPLVDIHSKEEEEEEEAPIVFRSKLEDYDASALSDNAKDFISHMIDMKRTTATNRESIGMPHGQGIPFGLPVVSTNNIPIPRHTMDYAQILQLEKKKNVNEICAILRSQGYSEQFVRSTRKKL